MPGAPNVLFYVADSLRAVISQKLLPRQNAESRIPTVEILRVTAAVRDCILHSKSAEEITGLMAQGRDSYGMQTFHQHLQELVETGMVEYSVARSAAPVPSDFELYLQSFAL